MLSLNNRKPPRFQYLIFDVITLVMSMAFGTIAALPYFGTWLLIADAHSFLKLLFALFTFFTYPAVFLLVSASYKRLRGFKLVPDEFMVEESPEKVFQFCREYFFHNFALSLFFSHFNHYYGLQTVFYRLMGAKVGKGVIFGRDMMIQDLSLVEIGDGVVFGQSSRITGHLQVKEGKMLQGRVKIGDRSMIGGHVLIGPNVTIGKGCVIGLNSAVLPGVAIPDGTMIPAFSTVRRDYDFKKAPPLIVPSMSTISN